MNTKRVSFTPPDNSVPEGSGSGEDFDLVCTFRVCQNGEVCMTRFGDFPMEGAEHQTAPAKSRSYDEDAQAMTKMRE
jgi:hypothetical protein